MTGLDGTVSGVKISDVCMYVGLWRGIWAWVSAIAVLWLVTVGPICNSVCGGAGLGP